MRIYVDTNALIAGLEGSDAIAELVRSLFETGRACGTIFVSSELTLGELLVQPLRARDQARIRSAISLFGGDDWLRAVPVTKDIVIDAADLRAGNFRLKWPDAVHIATAARESCTKFPSNDHGLPLVPDFGFVRLQEGSLRQLLDEARHVD